MLIKIVTRKYDYREKNGSVWALFFRRYRRLTVQELSIMKFPFGSSEKDTDAQTHCRNSPAARAKSLEWTYRVSSQESVLADVSVALAKETSDSQAELQGFSFFLHHIPTIVLQETPTQNPTWKQCKCDTVFTFLHFYEALHHKTAQQDSIVRSQQLTSFSVHSMSLLVDISLLSSLLSIIFNATACVAINQITVWIFIILWHKKYVSNKWSFGIGRKFVLFSSFNSVFVQTVIGSAGLGICWIFSGCSDCLCSQWMSRAYLHCNCNWMYLFIMLQVSTFWETSWNTAATSWSVFLQHIEGRQCLRYEIMSCRRGLNVLNVEIWLRYGIIEQDMKPL